MIRSESPTLQIFDRRPSMSAQTQSAPPATPLVELDRIVARLQEAKGRFAALSPDRRIYLLEQMIEGVMEVAEDWVAAAIGAKELNAGSAAAGEEWLAGPMTVVRNMRCLQRALAEIRDRGAPCLPAGALEQRGDGRLTARVFPDRLSDRLLFSGFRAEVWLDRSISRDNLAANQAAAYREPRMEGGVALVLGAGNIASIGPTDVLHKLFVENRTCVLKMNPVNEYLGPFIRRALRCLVSEDWFEVVYGGAEVGAHLVAHEGVEEIHITGSDATHDAIVWGVGAEQERRKKAGSPLLEKPIASELGNVTPVVVVPGRWSSADLAFQAENLAAMVVNNASFNCNAAKLLVTSADWPQREAFLSRLRALLTGLPVRRAYYPGARERWSRFVAAHPDAELLAEDDGVNVPWTLITDLDSTAREEICFRQEPFCAVLHEVPLRGHMAEDFLPRAVHFCNERVWGTLAASILVHPRSREAAGGEAALQTALEGLRYGSITVNTWPGLVFGLCSPPWGAYPGHRLDDIQSGRGFVHNTYMFDKPLKTVLHTPFRVRPKPPWFPTHKSGYRAAQEITRFEAHPSPWQLARVAAAAARG